MKVCYKKIKTNINWHHRIIDSYYQLSAADFLSVEELDANHVYHVLMRGKRKRESPEDSV